MTDEIFIKTPVGRVVQGDVQKGKTRNRDGKPYIIKTGPNANKPYENFFFALAIPKGAEQDWRQTEWGAQIARVAAQAWPQGQSQHPSFAWKIDDGDSRIPNKEGRVNANTEGFPGNWIMRFSTNFAPQVCNADGSQQITDPNAIKRGYYVQVYAGVKGNGNTQSPGVYLSAKIVALSAYGEEIKGETIDPMSIGFGGAPLPAGASVAPVAAFVPPAAPVAAFVAPAAPVAAFVPPAAPIAPPPPNPAILQPPVAPVRQLTPAANGATYEQLLAAGWTDETLIANGLMVR